MVPVVDYWNAFFLFEENCELQKYHQMEMWISKNIVRVFYLTFRSVGNQFIVINDVTHAIYYALAEPSKQR